jgi:hypothetical protein
MTSLISLCGVEWELISSTTNLQSNSNTTKGVSWLIENFIASNKLDASAPEEVEVKTAQFEHLLVVLPMSLENKSQIL